jgi:hypothetical protein
MEHICVGFKVRQLLSPEPLLLARRDHRRLYRQRSGKLAVTPTYPLASASPARLVGRYRGIVQRPIADRPGRPQADAATVA